MIDGEGNLGDQDEEKRKTAVENHYKWVEAAEILGCHSIRVNAGGKGSPLEVGHAATKSLTQLSRFAADYGINIVVENHGGYSSRASWLTSVIRNTGMVNCGTLPDFGNFIVDRKPGGERYDLYLGMQGFFQIEDRNTVRIFPGIVFRIDKANDFLKRIDRSVGVELA